MNVPIVVFVPDFDVGWFVGRPLTLRSGKTNVHDREVT